MQDAAETLKLQYKLRFASNEAYRQQVWKILCSNFFSSYIDTATARVLDVGAGWGEFINNIEAGEKFAIDLNPETRERLSKGIGFLHQDCSQPWDMESGYLDLVFTSNFLEHLNDKSSIERTVAESYRCLKDGGLFICMGPNIKAVPGAYWDFWDHNIPLTELSCVELLQMKGFTIERCTGRFIPYSMSTKFNPPLALMRLYLRLPLLWPLFGKQFLIVGRKVPCGK